MPKGSHNADLLDVLAGDVTFEMVSFIAARAAHLLKVDNEPEEYTQLPSPPISPHPKTGERFAQQQQRHPQSSSSKTSPANLPSLESFIIGLCQGSRVQPATLLTTLIYLDRLSRKLPSNAKGE